MLSRVNDRLCEGNPQGMFVTVFVGVLDTRTGEVRFLNGGHNPPILAPRSGGAARLAVPRGLLLGVVEGVEYAPARVRLAPGDTLLAYTDGVTEAQDVDGAYFAEARLEAVVAAHASAGAEPVVRAVRAAVAEFVGPLEPHDDVTLLAVTYRGPVSPRSA
jgi:sigma-B regulation protein RsbU (phosphoserine phosphatase)